jgi:hypothetical protein
MLAAALGTMWVWQWPWSISIIAGAVLRMAGQLGYLVLSSLTMNENLFAVMLANVHNLLVRMHVMLFCICSVGFYAGCIKCCAAHGRAVGLFVAQQLADERESVYSDAV